MFENDIVNLTYGDNLCRLEIIVEESEYVEGDTGHFTASASWTGGRRGTGNATFSETLTNPNGNLPAICLFFNENSQGWSSPTAYWYAGFNSAGVTLNETNKSYVNWDGSTISGSTPPFLLSNLFTTMAPWNLSYPDQDIQCTIRISADFPIFLCPYNTFTAPGFGFGKIRDQNDVSAETYASEVMNGDYTNIGQAVNFVTGINLIPTNQVWTIRCHLKKNGVVQPATEKAVDFKIKPDARIWAVWDNRVSGDGSANFILHISDSPWYQKNAYAPDSAYTETSVLDSEYWFGDPWQDLSTGDSYVPWCSTNIPYFMTDTEGDAYGRGDIGIDQAVNGGSTSFSNSTIGEDLSSTDIPAIDLGVSGVGCNAYALSKAEMSDLMSNYLYTTNQTIIQDIKDGIWYWGNNPIDFFIDCYYIPFSITDFYTTANVEMKFGSYTFTGSSFSGITETDGSRLELFTASFEGVYHDWRDFTQFEYDLYLPFVGFTKLDPQKYIDRLVKCEMSFDLTTHNVRYYLYADGVVTDRIDGSVGVNIPLMATDMVNKAKNDRQAIQGGVTGALSTADNLARGNVVGAIGSIINGMSSLEKLQNKATESVEGGFSSAMNIYDIRYAYLKITEHQVLIPNETNLLYNYPSYYMGSISSLSGYCELVNARFSSTATQPEIEEIESLLRNGVIL